MDFLSRRRQERGPEPLGVKVPAITALFWAIKLVTTGIGEATSDFLGNTNVALAGVVGIIGFWVALRRQFAATGYRPVTYWVCVLMVAVFGTMAADGVKDGTGISYAWTTLLYAAFVGVVFLRWWRAEGTLSIHSITTRRRERFYWTAVLGTFALGTAAGDLTAMPLHLGFFGSALLFAAIILIPAAGWRAGLNPVVAFWASYVVTRPLGASFADWFGKPAAQTGLGLGDGTVTALGLALFAALVAYVALTGRDRQPAPHRERHLPRLGEPVPAES